MGFESNHIEDALKLFKKLYGDDYKIDILVELTTQIKNKHLQITERISNHNKQTIGTQLYHEIYSFEPILASKITGMMLQWDTNKLIQLLNNPFHLQQLIKEAKCALDNVSFKPHMDLIVVQTLEPGDKIDFRNKNGRFILSTVLKKQNTQLLIHFDELSHHFDTWCDYNKELYRFAVSGSISARPSHRLQQLSVGDMIDFKPSNITIYNTYFKQFNWTNAKIISVDTNSGQIEVMYEINNMSYTQWTHRDNMNEICVFRTKHEYVNISMDLLNWKALEANSYTAHKNDYLNIKNVLLLNNNEIIVVSDRKIYKYQINLNKWTVWITHEFDITVCCLNEDKKILYIFSQIDLVSQISITQIDLLSLKHTVYYVSLIFPYFTYLDMLIVDNTLHFFTYDKFKKVGTHYTVIYNGNNDIQQLKVEHTFDNLSCLGSSTSASTAFIYCKERNILVLFGNVCGDKIFVYSLKQNKWLSTLINESVLDVFTTLFGFVLTNDEKYVMIFAGLHYMHDWVGFSLKYDQIGKIYLLDISNSKLIHCESINYLLKNTAGSTHVHAFKLWYPIIINKTTILIDGYLKQCWNGNTNFVNMRLLSNDVIYIIKGYYGYDNDELYIYSVFKGYLWNTKVNEIIKHQIPKLKFCTDSKILQQEQQKINILKNQLLKKHNDLTVQIHNQHQQQHTMYQQQFGFTQPFHNQYRNSFSNPFSNYQ